ncbi:MAG: creatininase family protein, partial [Chthoniobacterales bacterium]
PIDTDTRIAEAACHAGADRTATPTPVAPALAYTVSLGHTAKWPGTFSLSHATFIATVRELADWALATGWTRLLFINSHFGNDAALRVAVDQIRTTHLGKLQVGTHNVFDLTPGIWSAYTADAADLHANKAETDLLLHLCPEVVHADRLKESDDPDRTTGTVFSYPVSQTSLNGVTGFPSRATAGAGATLFDQITTALADLFERAKTETPPLG